MTATDVRPATKEQVESLGAKFLAVEDEEFKNAQTAGGYAKEMSAEYQAKQAALVSSHIAKQDIVITTALIPGRPAPEAGQAPNRSPPCAPAQSSSTSGCRAGRQCRGRKAGRGGGHCEWREDPGRAPTCPAVSPPTPGRSTPATSTPSPACS